MKRCCTEPLQQLVCGHRVIDSLDNLDAAQAGRVKYGTGWLTGWTSGSAGWTDADDAVLHADDDAVTDESRLQNGIGRLCPPDTIANSS